MLTQTYKDNQTSAWSYGAYTIHFSAYHTNAYDISQGNLHLRCENTLENAVAWIQEQIAQTKSDWNLLNN